MAKIRHENLERPCIQLTLTEVGIQQIPISLVIKQNACLCTLYRHIQATTLVMMTMIIIILITNNDNNKNT